jgi:hypothetical protein
MESIVEDNAPVPAEAGVAPAESIETPALEPSSASDAIDQLVQDYEAANPPAPKVAEQAPPADDFEQQLNELLGQQQSDPLADLANEQAKGRITELEGALNGLRAEAYQRAELESFDKYANELQAKLPEYCSPEHARNALLAAAAQDQNLQAAWRYRDITNEQRRAAEGQFRQLENLYWQVQQAPNNDPRKQTALTQIEQRAQQLQLMVAAPGLLLKAERDIIKTANAHRPIDPDASADRAAVSFAVKEAGSGRAPPSEPPTEWGKLTGAEGRQKVKDKYGFDPGWGH